MIRWVWIRWVGFSHLLAVCQDNAQEASRQIMKYCRLLAPALGCVSLVPLPRRVRGVRSAVETVFELFGGVVSLARHVRCDICD